MDEFEKEQKRLDHYKTLNEQSRLLLTLLTGINELKWYDAEKEDLCIIDDDELPVFTSTVLVLEEMIKLTQPYNEIHNDE